MPNGVLGMIIENGLSSYQIVTPGRDFPVENEAARILSNALVEITGVRIPVRWGDRRITKMPTIWVGRKDAESTGLWNIDSYAIRVQGQDLYLTGSFRRGVFFAVSVFLEQIGVRFIAPEKVFYPKLAVISLPKKDICSIAAFAYRFVFYPDTQIPEWALMMKLNVHDGRDARWGLNDKAHSFSHSFRTLVPFAKYFDTHPEYFSMVDGHRRKEKSQLCCTNIDVVDVVCASLEERMMANPDKRIFSVGQNDWDQWCECPECAAVDDREGTHMGQVLTLVNRVAERFPDKIISTLAYTWSVEPPRNMRAADNVLIVLCHNSGCFSHGLDQCEINEPFLNRLKKWKGKADNILIWDYYVNYRHYLLPTANFRRLQNDLRLYRDLGIKNMFCQDSASTGGQFEHLRQYVQSKLLWDPDMDVEKLMKEWAEYAYGVKAAAPILEYIFMLEGKQEKESIHRPDFAMPHVYELFTPEVLKKGKELWDEAEELAVTEEHKRNVFAARSAEMAGRLVHTEGEYRLEEEYLKLFPPVDAELVDSFTRACLASNVSYLTEDTGTPEDFQRDFGRTYEAEVLENKDFKMIILPEMGGRIYSIVLKETGQELMSVPDIFGSINYAPYSDGYDFSLSLQRLGPGAVEEYSVVSKEGDSVIIEASLENGCSIKTEYELTNSGFNVRHLVANRSKEPILIEPMCNPAWNRKLFDDDSVIIMDQDIDLNPEKRETRAVILDSDECPDGIWTLNSANSGISIRAEFPSDKVSEVRINMNEKMLQLQHCFRERKLESGDTAEFVSAWNIKRGK